MTVKGNRKQTVVEPYIKIMEYNFERVRRCVYLGSLVNENSNTRKKSVDKYRMQVNVTVD
jgi:hypothetical protein